MADRKSRILLLDTGKEWGGGTNSMLELLGRLDRSRFAVDALFYRNYARGQSDVRIGDALAAIGVPLRELPPPRQPRWAWAAKELMRGVLRIHRPWIAKAVFRIDRRWRIVPLAWQIADLLAAGRYDMLYLNNQPSSNLEGIMAARIAGTPCVQHCRIEATLNLFEVDQANTGLARIICVSEGIRGSLVAQGIHNNLCQVVRNGIDVGQPLPEPAFSREQLGIPEGAVIIGSIGSLIARKGFDILIDAFSLATRCIAERCHLIIAGEGVQRPPLEAQVRRLGLATQVSFLGFVDNGLGVSHALDIAVLASAKEGLPRVLLEAMWLGKPVVASDVVGPRELVVDGETGWLFPYGDRQALARHLSALIGDARLRTRMGQAGRRRIVQQFSIERYVEGVERVWRETLSRPA